MPNVRGFRGAIMLLCLVMVVGCVPVPIPPVTTLNERPSAEVEPVSAGETIAVISMWPNGVAITAGSNDVAWMANCVQDGLQSALPTSRVLGPADLGAEFYPAFTPGPVPTTPTAVQALMARPALADFVRAQTLHYVIAIATVAENTVNGIAAFPLGVAGGRDKVRATAQIIDLKRGTSLPGGTAESAGAAGFAFFVIGVVLLSPTHTAACHELTDALAARLRPGS